jgi:hypothetical protein
MCHEQRNQHEDNRYLTEKEPLLEALLACTLGDKVGFVTDAGDVWHVAQATSPIAPTFSVLSQRISAPRSSLM